VYSVTREQSLEALRPIIADRRLQILQALQPGPATARQIADRIARALGLRVWPINRVTGRISELLNENHPTKGRRWPWPPLVLVLSAKRWDHETHRDVWVYALNAQGLAELLRGGRQDRATPPKPQHTRIQPPSAQRQGPAGGAGPAPPTRDPEPPPGGTHTAAQGHPGAQLTIARVLEGAPRGNMAPPRR